MILGLCACSTGVTPEQTVQVGGFTLQPGQLLAGYSKVNITPEDSVPLAGFGNSSQRMSTGFTEYIYATCIALTDSQNNTTRYARGSAEALAELYVKMLNELHEAK